LGKSIGISSKLIGESDHDFVDFVSYLEKAEQHNSASILTLGVLPSSVKRSSVKVIFNPEESETKEVSASISFGNTKPI
jgi:hypothetical protein